MQPHVYAHMLVWNDRRYLADVLGSLKSQTYPALTLRVLDNGSTDSSLEFLKAQTVQSVVGRNVKNLGFAEGHNQLIRFTLNHLQGPVEESFILIMNADMILKETLVEELVKYLVAHPEIDAVQPKLYRAFGEHVGDESLEQTVQSDVIDTTGLRLLNYWRMTDRGAGELDEGQYDQQIDIIGPTGTMMMIRVPSLLKAMVGDEFYDSDFFCYREDCDAAWRMKRLGLNAHFVPSAIAWHYRGMFGAERQTWRQRIKNRRSQRPFFAALSTRNQLFVLMKNLTVWGAIKTLPLLLLQEGSRVVYGFLAERETRRRLLGMWRLIPTMWRKRRAIMPRYVVPESELRAYAKR